MNEQDLRNVSPDWREERDGVCLVYYDVEGIAEASAVAPEGIPMDGPLTSTANEPNASYLVSRRSTRIGSAEPLDGVTPRDEPAGNLECDCFGASRVRIARTAPVQDQDPQKSAPRGCLRH